MQNLQTTNGGEAVSKRLRTRKSHWRRELKQLTRGLKMRTACYVPHVIPKNLQRPRSAESEFGLKWQRPAKKEVTDLFDGEKVSDKYLFNPTVVVKGKAHITKHILVRKNGKSKPVLQKNETDARLFHNRDKGPNQGSIVARKPLTPVQEFKTFDQDF